MVRSIVDHGDTAGECGWHSGWCASASGDIEEAIRCGCRQRLIADDSGGLHADCGRSQGERGRQRVLRGARCTSRCGLENLLAASPSAGADRTDMCPIRSRGV